MSTLENLHGSLLIVRPPVPATCNKAGANYKSEVTHLEYAPRRAYDEWLTILDAIVACGGDALYAFEAVDQPLLGHDTLRVDAGGDIRPDDSREVIGNLASVETGRVFTANGPWVTCDQRGLRAILPNMLAHRRSELGYYRALLGEIATAADQPLEIVDNPARWEGMADVAAVGDKVILTYTVAGHYDAGVGAKSGRSSREGCVAAADYAGVPQEARVFAELVYPHFHGDTVHFSARPADGSAARLIHYDGGLWDDGSARIRAILGHDRIVPISRPDAVDEYAGNSRQVNAGVLVPDGVSARFASDMERLGLAVHRIPLFELFGKAGGGPGCATLYLPSSLQLPPTAPMRYGATRQRVRSRRETIPSRLLVDRGFFDGRPRG